MSALTVGANIEIEGGPSTLLTAVLPQAPVVSQSVFTYLSPTEGRLIFSTVFSALFCDVKSSSQLENKGIAVGQSPFTFLA